MSGMQERGCYFVARGKCGFIGRIKWGEGVGPSAEKGYLSHQSRSGFYIKKYEDEQAYINFLIWDVNVT